MGFGRIPENRAGGISIIGTRGVVEPRSDKAYKTAIKSVIQTYCSRGITHFIITPGFVGEKFLLQSGVDLNRVVTVGDHIGYSLTLSCRGGATGILLAGHIGKLSKIAAGIFNTHYTSGDARLEVVAAWATAAGASREVVEKILSLKMAEDAIPVLSEHRLENTYRLICKRIVERMDMFIKNRCKTGCVLLSLSGGFLGEYPEDGFVNALLKGTV